MPFLNVNGQKLFYQQHGKHHLQSLVLIGGLGADHSTWLTTAHKLAQDFHTIIFDNRGVGQSSAPEGPYTTEEMAQDTLELMTALNIPQAHIAGHSLGAYIAQCVAINSPERVNKLALIGGKAYQDTLGKLRRENSIALMNAQVDKKLCLENSMLWLLGEKFLSNPNNVRNYLTLSLNNPHPQTQAGYLGQAAATLSHDTRNKLSQICAETLVITGQDDINTPLYHAELLQQNIPQATLKIIPDCGHIPQLEQPQILQQFLFSFFKQ